MDAEKIDTMQDAIDPKFGELKLMWSMKEYEAHDRGPVWYAVFLVVSFALIVYAVLASNYIFALLIVLLGLMMVTQHLRPPEDVPVLIFSTGIVVGEHFHLWKEVRDFSLVYQPPHIRHLYIDVVSWRHPLISIDLPEDQDPNAVRAVLLEFAQENTERDHESLTDLVRRLYKL